MTKAMMTSVDIAIVIPMIGPTFSMSVKKIPMSESSESKQTPTFNKVHMKFLQYRL